MGTNYIPESISAGLDTTSTLNTNMTNIQTSLSRMLNTYGDSTVGTNAMQVALDMNSNRIVNTSDGLANSDCVTLRQLQSLITSTSVQDITNVIVVTGVANLKAIDVTDLDNLHLAMTKGYASASDGGEGTYYYHSTSTSTDNGGTVLAPDAGTGRWLLIYDSIVDVKQFGAVGDNATNDSAAVQAAMDSLSSSGGTVTAGAHQFYVPTTLNLVTNVTLEGAGKLTQFRTNSSLNHVFSGSSVTNVGLNNLKTVGTGGASSSNGIDLASVTYSNFSDLWGEDSSLWMMHSDTSCNNNKYQNITNIHSARGGFNFHDSDSVWDTIMSLSAGIKEGVRFDEIVGCTVSNIYARNTSSKGIAFIGTGTEVNNCTISNLIAIDGGAEGIRIDIMRNCSVTNLVAYNNQTANIHLEDVRRCNLSNFVARDSIADAGIFYFNSKENTNSNWNSRDNFTDGMELKNVSSLLFSSCVFNENTEHGVRFNGAQVITFAACMAAGNDSAAAGTFDGWFIDETDGTIGNSDLLFDESCTGGSKDSALISQRYGINNVDAVRVDWRGTSPASWNTTAGTNGLIESFTAGDATPSVRGRTFMQTANTSGTTITDFDEVQPGKTYHILVNDTNTTIDFTSTSLKGNAGVDWSPTTGDTLTIWSPDGTTIYCDISDNTA